MSTSDWDRRAFNTAALTGLIGVVSARAEAAAPGAWTSRGLGPDRRAKALVQAMTLDEKLLLLRSHLFLPPSMASMAAMMPNKDTIERPADALGTAGYTRGVPRLGVPSLNESDASLGLSRRLPPNPRETTALPASILTASTWNPSLAEAAGAVIGREARADSVSVMLAGGCNLARDPRCGRTFEYYGEDPLLSGQMAGAAIRGIQSQRVISTVKHFAFNAQETVRHTVDERIDEGAARESDLLAFQIAIEIGRPGAVMSAYNLVNGDYCSENHWLLSKVLKGDWQYPGYVMSDWGNVHSTRKAAMAGLDQQSGQESDPVAYFGKPLKQLALEDPAVAAKVDEKARRILRSVIAIGVFDDPPRRGGVYDLDAHKQAAQRVAEEGIVLLANRNNLLPLDPATRRIALIGENADVGILSGGGSAQAQPPGSITNAENPDTATILQVDHPSSPLRAIRAQAPGAEVRFTSGRDHAAAAAMARECDVAIVIARRWDTEGSDAKDLALPDNQNALIAAVAAANPRTVVVLTTGGPVETPWLASVGALVAAWYPGIRGSEALARILFGAVNPSGRLAITFPQSISQLPRPHIDGIDLPPAQGPQAPGGKPAIVTSHLNEGADVGYRWFEKQRHDVLFPFGFGLSYTTFAIGKLVVEDGRDLRISCTVTNSGNTAGQQVVQIYARPPGAGASRRLIGYAKVALAPGETKQASILAERRLLAHFDVAANVWRIDAGSYEIVAGASSVDVAERKVVALRARTMPA